MELKPLSQFIQQQKEFIEINDSQEYTRVTVKIHQKGIVLRDKVKGLQIKTKKQQVCKTNQLLVAEIDAKVGGYGIVPENLQGSIVSSHYYLFDIDENQLLVDYLRSILKTKEFFSQIKAQGTTNYASIRPKDILKIQIPYCDITRQKEIVRKLNNITKERKTINNNLNQSDIRLIALKNAILKEAMQGKLIPQNPNDEPASRLLERINTEKQRLIKEKKIKKEKLLQPISQEEKPCELPKSWVWVRLGDIAIYGQGEKIESSNINPDAWLLDLEDIEKVTSRLLVKKTFKENPSKSTKNKFVCGDILYGKLRPYLDKVIVADEEGCCTTEIVPIKPIFVDPHYLRWYLKNPFFISHVNSLTYGVKMPRLGTDDAKKSLVSLPPLDEQKRIVAKIEDLFNLCADFNSQMQYDKKLSETLMNCVLKESFVLTS